MLNVKILPAKEKLKISCFSIQKGRYFKFDKPKMSVVPSVGVVAGVSRSFDKSDCSVVSLYLQILDLTPLNVTTIEIYF